MKYLFFLIILTLSSCSSLTGTSDNYDKFWPHELTLEADKSDYNVGDSVTLVANIIPKEADSIRLYEDRSKSFRIGVRARSENDIDMNDNNFSGKLGTPTSKDKIEVIEISPTEPYELVIEGRILKNGTSGIAFDFAEFGKFEKPDVGNFSVWGFWKPIQPSGIDSLEDFTESVVISVD